MSVAATASRAGPSDAWTAPEFRRVLMALAAQDPDGKVLDLRRDYGVGEWLTYGFSRLLASAGTDLLHLRSTAATSALTELRSWRGYVDPDADGKAFTSRRAALSWVGHWTYPDYRAALGKDLALLPLPDLGHGSKTGSGSWSWAISNSGHHSCEAAQFLDYTASDTSILAMTKANGAIPGSTTALALSPLHQAGGPLSLYAEQRAAGQAVPRPVTPDYPTLTAAHIQCQIASSVGLGPALTGGAAAAEVPAPSAPPPT